MLLDGVLNQVVAIQLLSGRIISLTGNEAAATREQHARSISSFLVPLQLTYELISYLGSAFAVPGNIVLAYRECYER